ncbi:hypothetical protein [Streptomyces sp. MS2.AVA.5]|uniref:Uncharacterized protein n=1 Tax=Streptomyces achmelvichensis TaxID=3134111 RepID=A0ACC6PKY6_9ACTN
MDGSLSLDSFLAGAKKAAHRAIDDHGRGEYDEFALHAGVAVEKLAKAVLVAKNPIYIAEMRGSAEMLFHLGGHKAASRVRTIGAAESIARVRMLGVLKPDRQLDLLVELRNGVAHTSSGEQAKALLPTLAESVEALLQDLGGDRKEFWERWADVMRLAVDHKRDQLARDVQVRIHQARHAFTDRFSGLPVGTKERVLSTALRADGTSIGAIDLVAVVDEDDESNVLCFLGSFPCPACACPGQLVLEPIRTTEATVTLNSQGFICQFCGLLLNSLAEIEASGDHLGERRAVLPGRLSFSPGSTFLPDGGEYRARRLI